MPARIFPPACVSIPMGRLQLLMPAFLVAGRSHTAGLLRAQCA